MTTFREQMDELLPEMLIHSVIFDHVESAVEVTFAELRDQAEGAGLTKTVAFERELFAPEIGAIESDLRDLIDEVMVTLRNEDAMKSRIEAANLRFKEFRREDDEDDDDDDD